MKFSINLDYKVAKKDVSETSNREFTSSYISFAVRSFYKDGLDNQFRRIWARIQRKLDSVLDENKNEVELEQAEVDFIKTAVKSAKFPSDTAKYVVVLEDALDDMKEKKEDEPKKGKS